MYIVIGSTYKKPDKLNGLGLTLSGTGQGIFTPLSLLDQILSADFFFKNFQTLLEEKIEINWVMLTPSSAH